MAKLTSVVETIEKFAPLKYSEEYTKTYNAYDNSGLIFCGEVPCKKEIKKVMICLDLTFKNAQEAVDKNVDLILTHHPFIYYPMKSVLWSDPKGATMFLLAKNDIAVYSAHLSWDIANGGVNDCFCDAIGMEKDRTFLFNIADDCGLGRVGDLPKKYDLKEFLQFVKNIINDKAIQAVGKGDVKRVAVLCGGGSDITEVDKAIELNADTLISGELKHHALVYALEKNINLIVPSHFASEHFSLPKLKENLIKTFKDIEVFLCGSEKYPYV